MPALLNGSKREKAKSKMIAEEKTKPVEATVEEQELEEQEAKEPKLTLLKKLEAEMLLKPYALDFPGVETSEEFCLEKCSRFILEPLGEAIATERDWLDFARSVWQWRSQSEDRRLDASADDAIARLEEDPRILEIVRQKLAKR